jgi:DNA-binding GntR family transcriptional regulator
MNKPLAKQAYGSIIDMILAGTLRPGDLLQEGKLGDELAMSRTPVREAIKRIEAEGLAVQEGRFLKVRILSAAEVEEIFYLRRVLERQCARNSVGIDAAMLDGLERRVLDLQRDGPGEEEEQRQVDDDFHYALARAAGNQMMIRTIGDLRRRTCMFDHAQVPERFGKSCQEHLDIILALRNKDGERAATLMDEHIAHARDAILGRLSLSSLRTPQ